MEALKVGDIVRIESVEMRLGFRPPLHRQRIGYIVRPHGVIFWGRLCLR